MVVVEWWWVGDITGESGRGRGEEAARRRGGGGHTGIGRPPETFRSTCPLPQKKNNYWR